MPTAVYSKAATVTMLYLLFLSSRGRVTEQL